MSPRSPKFRFYADENFPVHAGLFFKSKGHVVLTVHGEQMIGKSDMAQLTYAIKQRCILLTLDHDFKDYTFSQELIRKSLGVVVIQTSNHTHRQYRGIINTLLKKLTAKRIKGQICMVSAEKIRFSAHR